MGGTISVQSHLGKGKFLFSYFSHYLGSIFTFQVEMPVVPSAKSLLQGSSSFENYVQKTNNMRSIKRRILLAEDNPVNQKVIARILEKIGKNFLRRENNFLIGYSVDIVCNGREAVEAITKLDKELSEQVMVELDYKFYCAIIMDWRMPGKIFPSKR